MADSCLPDLPPGLIDFILNILSIPSDIFRGMICLYNIPLLMQLLIGYVIRHKLAELTRGMIASLIVARLFMFLAIAGYAPMPVDAAPCCEPYAARPIHHVSIYPARKAPIADSACAVPIQAYQ